MIFKGKQFQIIHMEPKDQTQTHSAPGPEGMDLTYCVPSEYTIITSGSIRQIKFLPRLCERPIDPTTLKSPH